MLFVEPSLGAVVAIAGALGLGGWLVATSMLFAFVTRGPEDVDLDTAILRRFLYLGPAYWVLGPIAILINALRWWAALSWARLTGRDRSELEVHRGWPGPLLPTAVRRIGALPAILGGEWAFRSVLAGFGEAWAYAPGGGWVVSTAIQTIPAYLVFVVSPRLATGAVLKVGPWLLRFALYFGAVLAGDHCVGRILG